MSPDNQASAWDATAARCGSGAPAPTRVAGPANGRLRSSSPPGPLAITRGPASCACAAPRPCPSPVSSSLHSTWGRTARPASAKFSAASASERRRLRPDGSSSSPPPGPPQPPGSARRPDGSPASPAGKKSPVRSTNAGGRLGGARSGSPGGLRSESALDQRAPALARVRAPRATYNHLAARPARAARGVAGDVRWRARNLDRASPARHAPRGGGCRHLGPSSPNRLVAAAAAGRRAARRRGRRPLVRPRGERRRPHGCGQASGLEGTGAGAGPAAK